MKHISGLIFIFLLVLLVFAERGVKAYYYCFCDGTSFPVSYCAECPWPCQCSSYYSTASQDDHFHHNFGNPFSVNPKCTIASTAMRAATACSEDTCQPQKCKEFCNHLLGSVQKCCNEIADTIIKDKNCELLHDSEGDVCTTHCKKVPISQNGKKPQVSSSSQHTEQPSPAPPSKENPNEKLKEDL
eukprot:TRINITY_DN10659_c1_g1_i2.p1 TRINITY_DN10659_c1_g1~~TRINITY_DN10659_c1_g1_i2.p1  ORF type:complete len:186 (+),score=1.40 TRINITY_DN10659_c1_g1_i2:56-613(+)